MGHSRVGSNPAAVENIIFAINLYIRSKIYSNSLYIKINLVLSTHLRDLACIHLEYEKYDPSTAYVVKPYIS